MSGHSKEIHGPVCQMPTHLHYLKSWQPCLSNCTYSFTFWS